MHITFRDDKKWIIRRLYHISFEFVEVLQVVERNKLKNLNH